MDSPAARVEGTLLCGWACANSTYAGTSVIRYGAISAMKEQQKKTVES